MPPSSPAIRRTVEAYLTRHPGERDALGGLLADLDLPVDVTARTTLPGHITCSAVVVDRQGRVLHVRHRASGLMLPPGGHVEGGDDTLLDTVLREVREETGIPAYCLVLTPEFGRAPIDICVHDIQPRPARGEPAHQHFDFLFVFRLTSDAPELALQDEEVGGAVWLPQDEVGLSSLRAKLGAAGLAGPITPVNASAVIHDGQGRYLLHLTMQPATRALIEDHAADRPDHPTRPTRATERPTRTAPVVEGAPTGTELHIIGVHLYLERDGKVLLGLRHPDSAYAGGTWHVLAGHCEYEAATECLVREAREEAGLVIDPADLDLVHTVHTLDRPGDRPRIGLFFRARHWEREPEVREPDKCVAWEWFGSKDLPERVVPYTRAAIEGVQAGRTYTELGWRR
ncbi:NUDIX domain-containing protein [Streptomyces sp. NPDC048659]|uniref:NUDIX domain-containing protein n=1 Tax=Streptomyces sp. NPDC048659 TaxID=3155489 RepID=UPI003436DFD6